MKRNSNIERNLHESATKQEKAQHNGVDTSRWGNTVPKIQNIPEGWQDHQGTQQLVRKYISSKFVRTYVEKARIYVEITVTQEEYDMLIAAPKCKGIMREGENFWTPEKEDYEIRCGNEPVEFKGSLGDARSWRCGVYLSFTCLGMCINKYNRREHQDGDILIRSCKDEYIHNYSQPIGNGYIDQVYIKIEK